MNEFRQQYLCAIVLDEEYEAYLERWIEYRKKTKGFPQSMNREAYKIHRSLFEFTPKNEAYKRAKKDSLKICNYQ